MRAGAFEDGAHVLRAKIDMASPNITMRDPVLYRIRRAHHHRTGDAWCIYPMYDFAHPPSDAIELITHSLCTLEFEDHRPLYDWLIENLPVPAGPPAKQIKVMLKSGTHVGMGTKLGRELTVAPGSAGGVASYDYDGEHIRFAYDNGEVSWALKLTPLHQPIPLSLDDGADYRKNIGSSHHENMDLCEGTITIRGEQRPFRASAHPSTSSPSIDGRSARATRARASAWGRAMP